MTKRKEITGTKLADVTVAPEDEARSLRERAMLVRLAMGLWRGAGQDEGITEEVRERHQAKGKIGTFTKRYMSRDMLSAIYQARSAARRYHKASTLPWGDSGMRLLPVQSFFEYKKQMTAYEREFALAVDKFMHGYDEAVRAQRPRLGNLWRAEDYPSAEAVRQQFRMAVVVEPIPTRDDFRVKLSKEESEEIRREYDQEVHSRLRGAVTDVFQSVHEAVSELQERLKDPDATIRSSSFAALRKLVASLPQLNSVVQDPQITAFAKRIAEELLAVDVDAVAHDAGVRTKTRSKADAILAALAPLQQAWLTGDANATE